MSDMDILAAIDAAVGCQQCGGKLDESVSDDFCGQDCQQAWAAQHTEPLTDYFEPWHRPWDFPGVGTEAAVSGREYPDESGGERIQLMPDQSMRFYPRARTAVSVRWGDPEVPTAASRVFASRDGQEWQGIGTTRGLEPAAVIVDEVHSWPAGRITAGPLSASMVLNGVIRTRPVFRLPRSTGDLSADWAAARHARYSATTDAQRAAVALRMESLTERQAEMYRHLRVAVNASVTATFDQLQRIGEQLFEAMRPAAQEFARAYLNDVVSCEHPERPDLQEQALQARRNRNTAAATRPSPSRRSWRPPMIIP